MRYFRVFTIGDGYHTSKPVEMEIDQFYQSLALAFQRFPLAVASYSDKKAWLQFDFNQDDGEGVAYFYEP